MVLDEGSIDKADKSRVGRVAQDGFPNTILYRCSKANNNRGFDQPN